MKIIYDENEATEIRQNADERHKTLFMKNKKQYIKDVKQFTMAAVIMALICISCVVAFIIAEHTSIINLCLFVVAVLSFLLTTMILYLLRITKEQIRENEETYEKNLDKFEYATSAKYNLFIKDREPYAFNIILGGPNSKTVNVEVLAKNTEKTIDNMILHHLDVRHSCDFEEITIDLMKNCVIYPVKKQPEEFQICSPID